MLSYRQRQQIRDEERLRRREQEALDRAKKKPKGRVSAKDVITITISLVAIIASLGTVYFIFLQSTDDLGFVYKESAFPIVKLDGNALQIYPRDGSATFLNRGNRSIVVNYASIKVGKIEPPAAAGYCANLPPDLSYQFDFTPFIIKPGEIKTIPFNLKTGMYHCTVQPPDPAVRTRFPVTVEFGLLTRDREFPPAEPALLFDIWFESGKVIALDPSDGRPLEEGEKVQTLLHQTTLHF